jgi:hypothetical protein
MTSYLIAHKVRGERAFDVAERITCPECSGTSSFDNGEGCIECDNLGYWWIIPTSGHRAYPYWDFQLGPTKWPDEEVGDPPDSLPDHYITSASPKPAGFSLKGVLAGLGLLKPTVNRRL